MKNSPPWTVTGMAWAVLILASWNIIRLISALSSWDTLLEFAPTPGPLYVVLSASFWTLAGLAAWWVIRRRYVHAQGVYALTIYAFVAWWWFDRVFFSQQPRTNTPFAAIFTLMVVIAVATDFFSPIARAYFAKREIYDQPTDQQTS